ncbi:hypothetical protein [Gemmatimonas phototrophica]|nr:hypothetical protein [Gemmatimonas phototrophica]
MSMHTPAASPPHLLSALTLVLGPPREPSPLFTEFQAGAQQGVSVADHAWAHHEHEALTALTHRDGSISTHTLLETLLGGVLQIGVLVADVERSWVRHADGQLYAAVTIVSEDVRPRAGGLALHDPSLVEALNAVSDTIATLDGRAWMQWSSRSWLDPEDPAQLSRSAALVGKMAEVVIQDSPAGLESAGDTEVELEAELLVAIRYGRAHADLPSAALTRELRALRHLDPMRPEWTRIVMDAFFLGALDTAQLQERVRTHDAAGLAFLYLGKERSDRLKVSPEVSPRFRGEIAAKTFMTAYALERLAPVVSAALLDVMTAQ